MRKQMQGKLPSLQSADLDCRSILRLEETQDMDTQARKLDLNSKNADEISIKRCCQDAAIKLSQACKVTQGRI